MKKVVFLLSLGVFLMVSCAKNEQKPERDAQVSDVSFTLCQQTKAATDGQLTGKVNVEFTNEGVKITHSNFEVTCDFTTVNVTHTFVNGVLRITQQGSPNEAKCICYTDVSYTIRGISQKEVNVIFINGEQVYCHDDNGQVVTFTPCRQPKANTDEISDRVDVKFTGDGVKITHYDFEVTCDFTTVNISHTYVNGVLRITQKGTPNLAKCICYTDVSYTIRGLSQKEVNVIFINGKQVYCYNDNNPQPSIKEGVYSGTFSSSPNSNSGVDYGRKVTLELKNGRFSSTDYSGGTPSANGAGTYSTQNDTIIFRDELVRCAATPQCDPILIGKYHFAFDGKRLKFSNGRYVFDLSLADTGGGCDKNVIINAAEFENAPKHHISVVGMKIEGNCLNIKFSASGCSGNSCIVRLIDSGNIAYSDAAVYPPPPPKRTLRLSLDNKEDCDAVFIKEMSFNIEDLMIQGWNKILLDVSGNQILYEY